MLRLQSGQELDSSECTNIVLERKSLLIQSVPVKSLGLGRELRADKVNPILVSLKFCTHTTISSH